MWPFKKKPFVRPQTTLEAKGHRLIEAELPWHINPALPQDMNVRHLKVTLDTKDAYANIHVRHPSGYHFKSTDFKVPKDVLAVLGRLCTDVAFTNAEYEQLTELKNG